ncbi:glycoside hydrolase family 3 C-terminal domain-containing protein [Carboxylicivirga sediminis]|uniref:Glycoside hydrolase family 3 C-terminal domain-containing protein n=1 Tax=Carboxylicivirga sediminis TaxID=2006564 RepID=A0A941F2D5_9BACT|nr:glycoside hydrolase family 3 C-terminal domain-containing protein [Carboxylicivirga sediminis]MBR8535029.1 glycoside hydrolase family 3 C-terminal domain-containing protein [Carboxylicivirga sediminis]
MKKLFIACLFIVSLLVACSTSNQQTSNPVPALPDSLAGTFLDHRIDMEERLDMVISQLSLEEKCAQLMHDAPGIERLGIKPYNWWNEALHGVARMGRATVFPQPIGMASTFDPLLIEDVATAISDEGRAKFNIAQKNGNYLQYAGLTYWSPNVNIFRDPRWGRGMETWGEDPFLSGTLGGAFVKGIQGYDPTYLKAAACAKHYAVHNGPEGLRHSFNAYSSPKDLYETYLPAFKMLVTQYDVEAVMCAYNRTLDVPCCGSTLLLTEILRNNWGFTGHVMSDCGALANFHGLHQYTSDAKASSAEAIKHDVSLNCGSTYQNLVETVQAGLISEADIDRNLRLLWRTRFKLGLFDPYGDNPYNHLGPEVVNSKQNVDLARKAAQKSVVLLKNNGVLPLKKDIKHLFAIGPLAADVDVMLGNYNGMSNNVVSVIEGIAGAVSLGTRFEYRHGFLLTEENKNPIGWAIGEARGAEACIAVVGINTLLEGEEGEAIGSAHKSDRPDLQLPGKQVDYLKQIRKDQDKPLIVVVMGGSPIALEEVHKIADAVIMAWYPGEQGGNAIADIIFGDAIPTGKLPVTFPKSVKQLPPYEDYTMYGRTYKYMKDDPMYPFGFGLNYAEISYSNISSQKTTYQFGEAITLTADISNGSDFDAEETVQLYMSALDADFPVPMYDLKGFKRETINAGGSTQVRFTIDTSELTNIDEKGEEQHVKGRYRFYIGSTLPSQRAMDLGAPEAVMLELEIEE